jgi:hypothetical protein
MPWIKVATCLICGKRVKLKRESGLVNHQGGPSIRCPGSNGSGKEVGWEWKARPV